MQHCKGQIKRLLSIKVVIEKHTEKKNDNNKNLKHEIHLTTQNPKDLCNIK